MCQTGVIFVDDVDLFIIKSCLVTEFRLTNEAQESLNAWGLTLIEESSSLRSVTVTCGGMNATKGNRNRST